MIDDLDRTIEGMLKDELGDTVNFSFDPPGDSFPAASITLPAIDIFLYDIRENLELRTSEVISYQKDKGVKLRPPINVDFSYLITAWTSTADKNAVMDEHLLLGKVLKTLMRNYEIPPDKLMGSLEGLKPLPRAFGLQAGRLQSLGEFWQALGGKPKAAINYTVTMSIDVHKAMIYHPWDKLAISVIDKKDIRLPSKYVLELDDLEDHVEFDQSILPYLNQSYTIEKWIKPTVHGKEQDLSTTNKWSHYTKVYDHSTKVITYYVNGVHSTFDTGQQAFTTSDQTSAWLFGWGHSGTCYQITEVRLWNIPLAQDSINFNMLRRMKGDETNLVGYWPFNDGPGDKIADITENPIHGVRKGGHWKEVSDIQLV